MALVNGYVSGVPGIGRQPEQVHGQHERNRVNPAEKNDRILNPIVQEKEENKVSHDKAAENVSGLFSYLNRNRDGAAKDEEDKSKVWGEGTFNTDAFGNSEVKGLKAMNAARLGIEARAKDLEESKGLQKALGHNGVAEAADAKISNLTGNLDILTKNLNNSVDKALGNVDNGTKTFKELNELRNSLKPEGAPQSAEEDDAKPGFAAPSVFGGNVAEQIKQASEAPKDDEMSIAMQISKSAQADHARSVNIMGQQGEIQKDPSALEKAVAMPQKAVANGISPNMF